MFDDLDAPTFNPMREVWFPLDISNASSFNCIMAHSAAHLAHLYAGSPARRGTNSSDALRYKAEAVKILRSWMSDPKKELSDDTFAAVVRLLSFEVRLYPCHSSDILSNSSNRAILIEVLGL